MLKKTIVGLGIACSASIMGCGDIGGGEDPQEPAACLVVSSPAEKDENVEHDASASIPGEGAIESYLFNFGDGRTYYETPSNAPDGNFDGKTTMSYSSAGDYPASVTVTNSEGLSDTAVAEAGIGYGSNSAGAYSRIEDVLENVGYTVFQNQDFQLFNPSTGKMVAFNGLKAELSDEILYVVYDWTRLTQEQKDTISARNAANMEPKAGVIMRYDSPNTIESILSGF